MAGVQNEIELLYSSWVYLARYWKAYRRDRKYVAKDGGIDSPWCNQTNNARIVQNALPRLLNVHIHAIYVSTVEDVVALQDLKVTFGWNGRAVYDYSSRDTSYDLKDKLKQYYISYRNGDTGSTYDGNQAYQMDLLDAQFNEGEGEGEGEEEEEGEGEDEDEGEGEGEDADEGVGEEEDEGETDQ